MNLSDELFSYSERLTFALRELYSGYGYKPYRMSKFEEYDLYSRNKDFLISDRVITFTDTTGRLMALKPDVTLSIIKNHPDGGTHKLYYNENVYRVGRGGGSFREIPQAGVECIGEVDSAVIGECLYLAALSLSKISPDFVLDIGSLDILEAFIGRVSDSRSVQDALYRCAEQKNCHGMISVCEENDIDTALIEPLLSLMALYGTARDTVPRLIELCGSIGCADRALELGDELSALSGSELYDKVRLDFSVVSDRAYYNGAVFKGFVNGVPDSVLSGGQYDKLMRRMKRRSRAVGFAVYLEAPERMDDFAPDIPRDGMLNVALPKGRLGEKVYDMFARAGFSCPSILEPGRKLIFENPKAGVRYFWVKPSDVAIYVERGAADIGVAGKDILLEYEPQVYELLDMGIGKCRMAVAAPKGFSDDSRRTLRVATKFSRIAAAHYAAKGRDIDIVHLNGSIEIAPILGLTDVIVDIVETGATLRENDLEVVETVVPISARLIANTGSYKFKTRAIERLVQELKYDKDT